MIQSIPHNAAIATYSSYIEKDLPSFQRWHTTASPMGCAYNIKNQDCFFFKLTSVDYAQIKVAKN